MGRRIQRDPRPRRESADQWRSVPRPVDWEARREAVIARDVVCQWLTDGRLCGSTQEPECDHIGDPADHSLENLRLLCGPHHRKRTAIQASEAAKRKRLSRYRPSERHPGLL